MDWPFDRIYVPREPTMDLAWAAGIAEGEGCFHLERFRSKNRSPNLYFRFILGMNDKDIVDRFAKLFDMVVKGPRKSGAYVVRTTDKYKGIQIAGDLWFFLGQRRREYIASALVEIEEYRLFNNLEELNYNGATTLA